jgi:hypothetical protein
LKAHEREEKDECLKACPNQRWHFSPFVVSTDSFLGKELRTLLKKLSALLAEKWEKQYSEMCGGYVNAWMSIAMIRATYLCLRNSQIPTSQMRSPYPQWEDKAGLGLFTHNCLDAPAFFFFPTLSPLNMPNTKCKQTKQ